MTSKQEAEKLLQRAEETLHNAAYDLDGGYFLATANRSYYTCYYCMSALLYTRSTYSKTHQGAHTKFSELFIKSGTFPEAMAADIALLFQYRQEADYDLDCIISTEEAATLVEKASAFLKMTKQYFESLAADEDL